LDLLKESLRINTLMNEGKKENNEMVVGDAISILDDL